MFHIVQWQMPTTNQKLQGIVWEICVKSMRLRKLFAVFYCIFQFAKSIELCICVCTL